MNKPTGIKKDTFPHQAQTETRNELENEVTELQQFHKPTAGRVS